MECFSEEYNTSRAHIPLILPCSHKPWGTRLTVYNYFNLQLCDTV